MLSKGDKARIERLSALIDEKYRRAEQAPDEKTRAFYLRSAHRLERTRRSWRVFPMSIWLWFAAIICILLPWSILNRPNQVVLGYSLSGVMLILVLGLRIYVHRRRRHTSGNAFQS